MSINKEETERIALLARIGLSEGEADSYTEQLNSMLGWVEEMKQVDVSGVEPTAYVFPVANIFREDEVTVSFTAEKALANAPEAKETFFKVPRIV